MNFNQSKNCPICGKKLQLSRLACSNCRAEFQTDVLLSPYDYLSENDMVFLETFLFCRGNLKEVQEKLNISYPTAKRKLDELLISLNLYTNDTEETIDLSFFKSSNTDSIKASDIIRSKLYSNGGCATISSINGKTYIIKASTDGKSFLCDDLPIKPPYEYAVFDVIVDLLIKQGGKAPKGNGRNYRLGYGDCTEDTVVGAIGLNYAGKQIGDSVYDPVFVLASILEWAHIAHNRRGFIELTNDYRLKLK